MIKLYDRDSRSATKRDLLANAAGRFVGSAPPFKTVVVVSYSAFDTFVIPGRTEQEKERLQESGEIFGYVYCGLRELSGDDGPNGEQAYRLRTPVEIEAEFLSALARVREADRLEGLLEVLKPLLRDPSFQRIGLTQFYANQNDEELGELFRGLSSGHTVVLKIVAELTAHISGSEPTLVLIDEPETHLHPPLLAAFLKSVRACLEAFDTSGAWGRRVSTADEADPFPARYQLRLSGVCVQVVLVASPFRQSGRRGLPSWRPIGRAALPCASGASVAAEACCSRPKSWGTFGQNYGVRLKFVAMRPQHNKG